MYIVCTMTLRMEEFKQSVSAYRSLCFQVFVSCAKTEFTEGEFAALIQQHNVDFTKEPVFVIKPRNYGEKLFASGQLMSVGGELRGMVPSVQPIYISECDYRFADMSEDAAEEKMMDIMDHYTPQIKSQFPDLRLGDKYYLHREAFSIQFRYTVKQYDPEVCHPQNLGKLMPMTVIKGCRIEPMAKSILKPDNLTF